MFWEDDLGGKEENDYGGQYWSREARGDDGSKVGMNVRDIKDITLMRFSDWMDGGGERNREIESDSQIYVLINWVAWFPEIGNIGRGVMWGERGWVQVWVCYWRSLWDTQECLRSRVLWLKEDSVNCFEWLQWFKAWWEVYKLGEGV